jgi:predicted PurR-regulated permease PerM
MAGHLLRFVLGFVFWVLVVYYLLLDGTRLREWFLRTVPLPRDQQDLVIHRFMDMASSIVFGNGVAGLIQGVAGGLLFFALGLPGPVLWGVVMAILAFIPVIGISLVYIPAALLLLLAGDTGKALAVLIPLAALATVVEYWLKPLMVGRRSQVHTLLVFLSMIGGIDAFGAVGLLLGPLMMTAFLTLVSIFQERYRPYVRSLGGPAATPDGPADGRAG